MLKPDINSNFELQLLFQDNALIGNNESVSFKSGWLRARELMMVVETKRQLTSSSFAFNRIKNGFN